MLVVSHSPATLRHMCDRAIWLEHGRIVGHGALDEVLDAYQSRSANPV
jgi:ABC-2 type transport system ATP-binding protein